ncbi:alpha/beta fold hydrolase [Bowmanella sp. Y26]|uniref:alpha/beta fold hydrolase n=1 Tax=Bowmanella yangjiangensis TaxID=2811230 RepID=UPI001BDD6CC2|nr:alpha/beta fold hydrolase [Bowmanella yangjiangensis]MBT1062930.1 alpha/beta fold hydrolase [Bowmanella yangjiangensis]
MSGELIHQSRYLDGGDHKLHIRHIQHSDHPQGPAVLMVHGSIENGRIFYNDKGRGLGSYLARQGFNVYVLDLRGRGQSSPAIGRGDEHTQWHYLNEDLPHAMQWVGKQHQGKFSTVAHSWGGVLMMACLLRHPHLINQVERQVFFGSKRSIRVHNPERWFKVDLVWGLVSPLVAGFHGYLPAKKLGLGADNETFANWRDVTKWVRQRRWIDASDGFDYQAAAKTLRLPATWFITGQKDYSLGHVRDMRRFMAELGMADAPQALLGKQNGNLHDYDHINILTHAACQDDHFPKVSHWLKTGSDRLDSD